MKKLISILMAVTIMLSFGAVNVGAYRIGDVINYAQPTDIAALINGYQMMSFNVDGSTYVVVEDLRHYGFNVTYDNASRALYVERNYGVTSIAPHITNPDFWKIGSNKKRKNILYTDIVTYVGGTRVNSYNIDGQTIIRFDELGKFGQVSYDNSIREISLKISDMKYNTIASLVEISREEELATIQPAFAQGAKIIYGSHVTCDIFFRAKGNVIVYEIYLGGVTLNAAQCQVEQEGLNEMRDSLGATFREVKLYVPELSGVAFIMYDGSGKEVASTTIAL